MKEPYLFSELEEHTDGYALWVMDNYDREDYEFVRHWSGCFIPEPKEGALTKYEKLRLSV